jgi:hypothetical protein
VTRIETVSACEGRAAVVAVEGAAHVDAARAASRLNGISALVTMITARSSGARRCSAVPEVTLGLDAALVGASRKGCGKSASALALRVASGDAFEPDRWSR